MNCTPNRLVFLTLVISSSLSATLINVPADSTTIQSAIDGAVNGDTVLVQPGTYVENINFNGKNIVVGSPFLTTGDTTNISQTVIDGNQHGSVVTFESGEDSNAVLSGFTIRNGSGTNNGIDYLWGGGIFCISSSPTLQNLVVLQNSADGGHPGSGGGIFLSISGASLENVVVLRNISAVGGGIYIHGGNVKLIGVTVIENHAGMGGGGIYIVGSSITLQKSAIMMNTAGRGGGIWIETTSSATLEDVEILDNIVIENDFGGGIYCSKSNLRLVNTVVARNKATRGGGIYWSNSFPSLQNVTITGNAADQGGGMYFLNSSSSFDPVNRCNIYFNEAVVGYDLYAELDTLAPIHVVADTFTIMTPNEGHAYPLDNFTFDILNAKEEPVGTRWSDLVTTEFALHQNYPNPFNPTSTIQYDLPEAANVTLVIYDILGREVVTLVDQEMQPGYHRTVWDARDHAGRTMPTGIYIARLTTPEYTKSIKMLLLK